MSTLTQRPGPTQDFPARKRTVGARSTETEQFRIHRQLVSGNNGYRVDKSVVPYLAIGVDSRAWTDFVLNMRLDSTPDLFPRSNSPDEERAQREEKAQQSFPIKPETRSRSAAHPLTRQTEGSFSEISAGTIFLSPFIRIEKGKANLQREVSSSDMEV